MVKTPLFVRIALYVYVYVYVCDDVILSLMITLVNDEFPKQQMMQGY